MIGPFSETEQDSIYRYERYYSKGLCLYCVTGLPRAEKYLADHDIESPSLNEGMYMTLNHPTSLRHYICENEQDWCPTYEGLIATYPIHKLIEKYKTWCNKNLDKTLRELPLSDVLPTYFVGSSGKLVDRVVRLKRFDQLVTFLLPAYKGKDVKSQISEIVDDFYICGYDLSYFERFKDEDVGEQYRDKFDVYKLQFEAKYSQEAITLSKTLYHVTEVKNLPKIRKQGLVPKSKSPEFKYKDRIYLFNVEDIRQVFAYKKLKMFQLNKAGIDTSSMQFCVLRIDRDKLQNSSLYKSGKMTFYYDPCYNLTQIKQLQDSPGIFTYNNIPRELIEDDFVMIP